MAAWHWRRLVCHGYCGSLPGGRRLDRGADLWSLDLAGTRPEGSAKSVGLDVWRGCRSGDTGLRAVPDPSSRCGFAICWSRSGCGGRLCISESSASLRLLAALVSRYLPDQAGFRHFDRTPLSAGFARGICRSNLVSDLSCDTRCRNSESATSFVHVVWGEAQTDWIFGILRG